MKITKRQLRRIIQEETQRLSEDRISDELEHLRKNIRDNEEHIDNLEKDIADERDEQERARRHEEEHAERNESIRITGRRLRNVIRETLEAAMEEADLPLQQISKDIEERGTGGEFSEWCGEAGVTQACIDRAVKTSKRRAKQAQAAVAFSHAKGGGPSLDYPKKKS